MFYGGRFLPLSPAARMFLMHRLHLCLKTPLNYDRIGMVYQPEPHRFPEEES